MKSVDFLIGPIGELNTPLGKEAQRGSAMNQILKIKNAGIAIHHNRIVAADTWKKIKNNYRGKKKLELKDKLVLPGFIDSHTHALFAKSRAHEYGLRLQGSSYLEIAAQGGGILNSCDDLRATSKKKLRQNLKDMLVHMRAQGTTTVEVKSGYGLTLNSEIKMLDVIKTVNQRHPMRLVPTFLGAHEIPREYKGQKKKFVDLIINNWLPEIAKKKLADFCDVFCDVGVFSANDAKRILSTAKKLGLKLKLHSDEFEARGGTEVATKLNATSVDHLSALTKSGLKALKKSQTIATLLPGTCLTLDLKWPPARQLIQASIPIALATDCNPGSCLTGSLPLIMSLACNKLKMTAEESLTAVTLNAAAALEKAEDLGSIEAGKLADLSFWNCDQLAQIPYHMNGNLCWGTLIGSNLSFSDNT